MCSTHAASRSRLLSLTDDLWLIILKLLLCPKDKVNAALGLPKLIAMKACSTLWKTDPLFGIAMHRYVHQGPRESLFLFGSWKMSAPDIRKFARDRLAKHTDVDFLNSLQPQHFDSCSPYVSLKSDKGSGSQETTIGWYLMPYTAILRGDTLICGECVQSIHYEGEAGHEHMVRVDLGSSSTQYYEGATSEEHLVYEEFANGTVQRYRGKQGEEHIVECHTPNFSTQHYEGNKGNERLTLARFYDGKIQHYTGERGGERLVRMETLNGSVAYYAGSREHEYIVRFALPNGEVWYYEGGAGNEHVVRKELACGDVEHYDGKKDEERIVRTNIFDGVVVHYEGEQGNERAVRIGLTSTQ